MSHRHILHQLSALSPIQSPFCRVVLFHCCRCCFSFTAVHFSLPPTPPSSKKLSCISAQRAPFCSSFFSFVHPPQYHQDDVKHLISFLSYLGGQFGTLQLMLSLFLETVMWQQDRLRNRLSHYCVIWDLDHSHDNISKMRILECHSQVSLPGRGRCSNNKMFPTLLPFC